LNQLPFDGGGGRIWPESRKLKMGPGTQLRTSNGRDIFVGVCIYAVAACYEDNLKRSRRSEAQWEPAICWRWLSIMTESCAEHGADGVGE